MGNAASSLKSIENILMYAERDALFVKENTPYGVGVFADREFLTGEIVGQFEGERYLRSEINDFTHFIEISYGEFLGPSGGIDDFFNHSCLPTTRLLFTENRLVLEALRDIKIGEEITFDYASCMVTDPTVFECSCSSLECRKVIQSYLLLTRPQKKKLIGNGLVPEWVQASDNRRKLLRTR